MTLPIVERLRFGLPFVNSSNHAELLEAADTIEKLVEALRRSNKIARALARGHLAFPDDVAALNASDALLAKIGGAA